MGIKVFDIYDNNNQAVRDAYEMIAANIHISNIEKKVKTIVLTSCNPKEGKTSLAISLSVAMANSGWRVLLIDADMRKPTAAKRLNEGTEHGLADFLAGKAELCDVIRETNIILLNYLSCGSENPNLIGLICSARFEELMEKVRQEYDFVLFDTPALESVVDGALIASKADAYLLVVKSGFTKLPSLVRAKEQLDSLNASILGVVLNKVKKIDYKKHLSFYNYFFNSERFIKNVTRVKRIQKQKQTINS